MCCILLREEPLIVRDKNKLDTFERLTIRGNTAKRASTFFSKIPSTLPTFLLISNHFSSDSSNLFSKILPWDISTNHMDLGNLSIFRSGTTAIQLDTGGEKCNAHFGSRFVGSRFGILVPLYLIQRDLDSFIIGSSLRAESKRLWEFGDIRHCLKPLWLFPVSVKYY